MNRLKILTTALLVSIFIFLTIRCEEEVILPNDDCEMMNPGDDPDFIDYTQQQSLNKLSSQSATWLRMMYVDKTDTFYTSTIGKNNFSKYLKKYGFTGVYFYSTSGIVSSSSNYSNFSNFLKQLNDSGVIYRAVASGSSTTFQSTGNISRFNASQSDPTRKINRANLELEWWNGACSWNTWNTTNQSVSIGTIPDNDFYEGWYKNMSTTIDTIASRDQAIYSDRILLHCYQNGIPTYSYANAKSSGATAGRLDIIAKGAKQANKVIDLFIIISAEQKIWGANNDFTGAALASASNQPNPFEYIETQAYNNIYGSMTAFQKQWINFKGFVWFTKRYCYKAIPPQ